MIDRVICHYSSSLEPGYVRCTRGPHHGSEHPGCVLIDLWTISAFSSQTA